MQAICHSHNKITANRRPISVSTDDRLTKLCPKSLRFYWLRYFRVRIVQLRSAARLRNHWGVGECVNYLLFDLSAGDEGDAHFEFIRVELMPEVGLCAGCC